MHYQLPDALKRNEVGLGRPTDDLWSEVLFERLGLLRTNDPLP